MEHSARYYELKKIIWENEVTAERAAEALKHHLNQLTQLGATLEDDVCEILRKCIAAPRPRKNWRTLIINRRENNYHL